MWAGYSSSSTAFPHPESWSFQPLAISGTLDGVSRFLWPLAWCEHHTCVPPEEESAALSPDAHKLPHFPSTDGSNPNLTSLFTGVILL